VARPTLEGIGERREFRLAGVRFVGRRRRPSGEPAPLPHQLHRSGQVAALAVVAVLVAWVVLFLGPEASAWWTARDGWVLDRAVELRGQGLTALARAAETLGSAWVWRPLRLGVVVVLVVLRRWRHLLVAMLALFLAEFVVGTAAALIARPRPLVAPLTGWEGYAHPSAPVASLAVTLTIMGLVLLPAGRRRAVFGAVATGALVTLALARVYLGVDHPTDVVAALVLGSAIPLLSFRLLASEVVFPITYRRGRGAHLEIDERRAAAIRRAMRDQLGVQVHAIEPFGLASSGGSTPLRLTVAGTDDDETVLFAKLYSTCHLRADRWYKAARTILYGSLEDELRHPSVRRLVEREDYLLLLMAEAGVPCPRRFGIVEITPEREYLTVTEFLDGAVELHAADVDGQVIDEGLAVIRRMWDAGLAHRDIKPGNVLVQDGHVRIVDVAFSMVRPSPWRQAVDLANMLLILALRSSAEEVYARALQVFPPEDIAEAFAATRSVTIPAQSRSSLRLLSRTQGLDLVRRFESLSPPRDRIAIQRWNGRRVRLTLGAFLLLLLLIPVVYVNLTGGGFL
jgi:tRNA A-37 threonylcarbamoyl transferase component Bud32/membrane-associated phospholipid phosphatase